MTRRLRQVKYRALPGKPGPAFWRRGLPVVLLNEVPAIINDIIWGRRQVITYDKPPSAVGQYLMPAKYAVLPPKMEKELPPDLLARAKETFYPIWKLKEEDPAKTVIVACSNSMWGAWKDVKEYGDFPVINYFMLDHIQDFMPTLGNLPLSYVRSKKNKTARRAIIVRGPIDDQSYFQVIQKIAHDHPDDYMIVSSWKSLGETERAQLDKLADLVILNDSPVIAGIQHRNFQLACIKPAIRAALEAGVERILITRSDHFLANPFMLEGFDTLLEAYPGEVAKKYGQKGRLIVPDFATRYYLPYHPSDILTYGYAEDVARFWMDIPPDPDEMDEKVFVKLHPLSIKEVGRMGVVVETYFAAFFMEKIGRPFDWTLADSLAFYRDFFIVIDGAKEGMFWFRKFWYDHAKYSTPLWKFMSHPLWRALASGVDIKRFADRDLEKVTWRELTSLS